MKRGIVFIIFACILLVAIPFTFSEVLEDTLEVVVTDADTGEDFVLEVTEQEFDKLKEVDGLLVEKNLPVSALLAETVPLIDADDVQVMKMFDTNLTGAGQAVCVIDTGVDIDHPAFTGRVVNGYDFFNDDSDADDDNGHGSHCAGIAAGAGGTITGVAPNATIVAVKILDAYGNGDTSTFAPAIDWCVNVSDLYNITVISLSLGTDVDTVYGTTDACDVDWPTSSASVAAAIAKNITVVASSGNDGSTTKVAFPACLANITAVGATDDSDSMWAGTNRNGITDLMAPGVNVYSAINNGGYASMDGTSMAAPHVAGAVLLLQYYKRNYESKDLLPSDIVAVLNNTGVRIDDTGSSGRYFGRIDVDDALYYIDDVPPVVSLEPESGQFSVIENNTRYKVNVTVDDVQLSNITFRLYNDTSLINVTVYSTDVDMITYQNLSNQTSYSVIVVAVDNKSLRTVEPSTPPLITIDGFNTTYFSELGIGVNYTVDELDLDSVWYELDSDPAVSVKGNFTFNATEGNHTLTLYANDTWGATNLTVENFEVITYPILTVQGNNSNITVRRKEVNLTLNVSEVAQVSYSFDSGPTVLACSNCSQANVTISLDSFGVHTLYINAVDSLGHQNNTGVLTFNMMLDTDDDGIPDIDDPDDDDDGINDTEDFMLGFVDSVETNIVTLNLSVDDSYNLSKVFNGTASLSYDNGSAPYVNFTYNFTNSSVYVQVNVTIRYQNQNSTGYTLIYGLDSDFVSSKVIYVDNVLSGSNAVCVKDAEVTDISNVSAGCSATNETIVLCPGSNGGYTCSLVDGRYQVTGLSNSAVKEYYYSSSSSSSSTASTGGGGGGGGGGSSTPSTKRVITISSASPEKPIDVTVNSAAIPVSRLVVNVGSVVSYGKITVEVVDDPEDEPLNMYKYFKITTEKIDDIENALIYFAVEKSWLDENGFDITEVKLEHKDGAWETISPDYVGLNADSGYEFVADVDGFSDFAIVAVEEQELEVAVDEFVLPVSSMAVSDDSPDEEVLFMLSEKNFPYFWLFAGLAVLFGIILLVVFLLLPWIRRKI